ncbi:MAG: response regulator receiver protein [Bacteroidota bacterium]|nr:response regulator receiver protein [Bacteroidota bacterium]
MKTYNHALIIDDDADLCVLLKTMLADIISDIKYAHSIESGRTFLNTLKPDIIFLDNNLPDGQGLNYIEEIKALSGNSILVIITALESSKNIAYQRGADIFIEKPLTYSNIRNAIDNYKRG